MKRLLFLFSAIIVCIAATAKDYRLTSPDGKISITVAPGKDLTWSVTACGDTILAPSAIGLSLYSPDGNKPVAFNKVAKCSTKSVNKTIPTPLYKKSEVADCYNQMNLTLKGGYIVQFRAYNDGAAYRIVLNCPGKTVTIANETAEFNFPADFIAYIPYVNDNRSGERYTYSFESFYDRQPLSAMYADSLAITPLLVDEGKYRVAVSDFGIDNYPGMFLKANPDKTNALMAEFATVPLDGIMAGHNKLNYIPTSRAAYIARDLPGTHRLPWRALIIADDDRMLANNDMAVRLSRPSEIADVSWIKPGKVAWDWWNNLHITGVDFKAGVNTPTYKYYIDFASANGLEYIIIDEGWSDTESIMKVNDTIDIPAIINYGKDRNVGVILWASWKNIHREVEAAMKRYADLGVAGFKIDFFDADDQNMVRDMERFARLAADNRLVLDYHGMKANGMQVTYPNILNFEGVKGLENYRWSSVENDPPGYAVTIPYIRTLVGPMDYTPGAMINTDTKHHRADNDNPMSEGTRANQIAMYIVYDAPLQMLADSPTRYMANQHCTDFIAAIPTVFDQTIILDGSVGEYIVTARRKGDTWYVGAMTNRTPRTIDIDLSFLGEGNYQMLTVADGVNTDIDCTDHRHSEAGVTSADIVHAELAPAGGWAAILVRR